MNAIGNDDDEPIYEPDYPSLKHRSFVTLGDVDDELLKTGYDTLVHSYDHPEARRRRPVGPCPCECNSGGFCGGCGHAGCGGLRRR